MPRPAKKTPAKKIVKNGPQARTRASSSLNLRGHKATARSVPPPSSSINTALFFLFCLLFGAACVLGYQLWLQQSKPAAHDFMSACVRTVTPDKKLCGDRATIKAHFKIDADALIEQRRLMMVATAKRMVSGELRNPARYKACLDKGECATIPLLPAGVTAASVADSNAHLETREAFWQLTQGSKLTPQICSFIEICNALRHSGAITFP